MRFTWLAVNWAEWGTVNGEKEELEGRSRWTTSSQMAAALSFKLHQLNPHCKGGSTLKVDTHVTGTEQRAAEQVKRLGARRSEHFPGAGLPSLFRSRYRGFECSFS